MKPYLINVSVAIIFFIRPDTLELTFAQIQKARPSKLFLIQDGPRQSKPEDIEKVKECRKIIDAIDWECEVYRNYSEINQGCGNRTLSGLKWVFENVDRAIILEDDCVADESFFRFCAELLDKYENDTRINMITGFNHLGIYEETSDSYFYGKTSPSTGWATWRRCWDMFDTELTCIDDERLVKLLKRDINNKSEARRLVRFFQDTRKKIKSKKKVGYWAGQWGINKYIYSGLVIISTKNMIKNIGVGPGATYSGHSYELFSKRLKKIFFMDIYEMKFPLKHPKYMICDHYYDDEVKKLVFPNIIVLLFEKVIRRLKMKIFRY